MRGLLLILVLILLGQEPWHVRAGERKLAVPTPSTNIHNLLVINERIFSGSAPEDEKAFQELQSRGIKTILSVDGMVPQVELAKKFGIRYVHIPVGYDGIKEPQASQILKAAESAEGKIFVHCHHGKHRGPAAVAVICKGRGWWNESEALNWLSQAGTSSDYPGLFDSAKFARPSQAALDSISTNFPEKVESSGLVKGMVDLDKYWDELKALLDKEGNLHQSSLSGSAVLAVEALREMQRLPESKNFDADFMNRLAEGESFFKDLHQTAAKGTLTGQKARALKQQISTSCSSCHRKYRN